MPPRLPLHSAPRVLPIRPRSSPGRWCADRAAALQPLCRRGFADSNKLPESKNNEGPNTDTLPHVSEEAAAISKARGEQPPDIEQGTPVQEVVKGDKEAEEKLPKVMRDSMKKSTPSGSRSYSTSAIRRQDLTSQSSSSGQLDPAIVGLDTSLMQQKPTAPNAPGLKFGLPSLPIPSELNIKHRYDPVVAQVTNLLMRDGKLSVAQRNVSLILTHLRTSPPPTISPNRPLLPGAPPPSHLPLNPILYLTLAIDSVAPLLRIRSQRGAAGGGVALQIPVPLGLRQRRRTAVQWILDAASKRKNRGSGKGGFAQRVAEELIAVVEGRSGVWDRRGGVHKLGVSARANLNFGQRRR